MSEILISAIVIAKNEEAMIANCLETLKWCDEVIVVDDESQDTTPELAKRSGAVVIHNTAPSFAEKRNVGLSKAKGKWIFYIDADERVTPKLAREIQSAMLNGQFTVYQVRRNNIQYGKWMEHGGWENDWVERLFQKDALPRWTGHIHESPQIQTKQIGQLMEPLVHLTHRNMVEGLQKTIDWTGREAELLFDAGHPPVRPRTLLRKTIMEFIRRAYFKKGRKDGIEGWIESLTQAMNRFIVYERLWELQRQPNLHETYQKIDKTIIDQWEKTEHVKTEDQKTVIG